MTRTPPPSDGHEASADGPRHPPSRPRDGEAIEPYTRLRTDGGPPGGDGRDETGVGATGPATAHARAVADALSAYETVVEVGIGRRTDVAGRLHERGVTVVAVDRRAVATPDGVRFLRDDVTDPRPGAYPDAGAVYALNLPPDLQGAVAALARALDADLVFTTLGTDPATLPTTPEAVAGGTLHWMRERERRD